MSAGSSLPSVLDFADKVIVRMAVVGSITSVPSSRTGRSGRGTPPPVNRGGDDSRGDTSPHYPQRLRRARMALFITMAPIAMFFVILVAAAIARHSTRTLDEETNSYVRNWTPVQLPLMLLMVNTVLLLASSLTAELARRQIARQAALSPVRSIPGISLGKEREIPWLGLTVVLGASFLSGQWMAWRELARRGLYVSTSASSFFSRPSVSVLSTLTCRSFSRRPA